jgi:hypothetical protein
MFNYVHVCVTMYMYVQLCTCMCNYVRVYVTMTVKCRKITAETFVFI